MNIKNTTDLKVALRAGPYAWPGGYPTYFIAADGEPLCHNCVKQNFKQVVQEHNNPTRHDQFRVIGQEINHEDTHLYCAHCEQPIETAYN